MIKSRGRFCFQNKTTHGISLGVELSRKNIERNSATEDCVLRQIDFAHCARAWLRTHVIAAEFCSGSNRHFWGRDGRCELVPKLQLKKRLILPVLGFAG